MKMMIVDDSRTMRSFLAALAQDLSFDISEAANGQEALSKLDLDPDYDVALVDWDMPKMNGIALVTAIRQHHLFDPMKIMMVTSHHDINSVCLAIEKGADDFLMKPVTQEMLQDKLRILGLLD